MNVSKYIKRERAPKPTIHENDFIEEFKNPHHFSISGAGKPLDGEISGGRAFAIHKSENIPLDNFAFDAHERIRAGEHPWDVYGSYGTPLDLPIEANLLLNPNNLNDKEVFVARWQEEEGTTNNFTQRLENFKTNKPLTEIRGEESDYQSSLRLLKSQLDNDILPSDVLKKQYKTDKVKATENITKVTKGLESLKKVIKRRPKIVVEPAVVSMPPPSSGTATASGAPLSSVVTPPPPPKTAKTHKRTDSGESQMSDITSDLTSAAAESYSGTSGEIDLLVDIGNLLSKSSKLDASEIAQIITKMKKATIFLPPNTTTKNGLLKKYKEYIKKHHVKDSKLESFVDL